MSAQDTTTELWGGETRKAVDNFPVSGERVPVHVVRWLGRIKGAAARTNAELGLLDDDLARRIAEAGDEIAEGKHDDQFPIDVFPSAVHLAALGVATDKLLPALEQLEASLQAKADAFADYVKSGRTHLMDAVPVAVPPSGICATCGSALRTRLAPSRICAA